MIRPRTNSPGFWLCVLSLVVLAFFGDVLVAPHGRVLSREGTDVWRQFAGWRAFGFGVWRDGDFPLWNPFVYGGMPYFTGFQSALLYPANALFLGLPLLWALNWSIALHAAWLAAGTFLWLIRSRLHPMAAAFGSLIVTFGGAHFAHVYAGHLPNLCEMAWAPWLFVALAGWRDEARARWLLLGAACCAMQVFAGHPQYAYYSWIAATFLAIALALAPGRASRARFAAGVAGVFVAGAALSAVQWLPALLTLDESVRSASTDAVFAGSYSFPPENLLTAIAPRVFGDGVHGAYWGRWFFWESCAFVGVAGLVLLLLGAVRAGDRRGARTDAVLLLVLVILALGAYTPLFGLVLHAVPGWSLFRGTAKLAFFAGLFAARLAARGADAMLRPGFSAPRAVTWGGAVAPLLILGVGASLVGSAAGAEPGWWTSWRERLWSTGQVTHVSRATFFAPEFVAHATRAAGGDLLLTGLKAALCYALVLAGATRRWAAPALLALGSLELVTFAIPLRKTFPLADLVVPEAVEYRQTHDGDFRVLDQARSNGGLLSGLPDVWGDDPGVLRRYAEFVAATQGLPPSAAGQSIPFRGVHPRWDLLRFRAVLTPASGGVAIREVDLHPLDRFEIVPRAEVLPDRDAALARVLDPGFDPRGTVVLEAPPAPAPPASASGTWEVVREGVDDLIVRVTAPGGGVLLMTDPYCRGWTARAVGASPPQPRYDVLPADWAFRGIPLAPGTHEIRLCYVPPGLTAGAAISAVAWLSLAACGVSAAARRRRAPTAAGFR